jgi:poly(A) polymerase
MQTKKFTIDTNLIEDEFKHILYSISESKYTAYLVGGAVRDLIAGNTPNDFDFVVEKNINEFTKFVSSLIKGKIVKFDNHGMNTFRVVNMRKNMFIDITEFQNKSDGLIYDLSKRDFTINSMAIKIDKSSDYLQNIIDPFDGINDLNNKVLRYTTRDTVLDDPLRLIRLVRLSAKLKFNVERNTLDYFKNNAFMVNQVSTERIRDELIEIFSLNNSYQSILLLAEISLLEHIFPEIKTTRNVEQLGLHDKDVYEHQIAALYFVEKLLDDQIFGKIDKETFAHDKSKFSYIKFATFFHDIGKPATKQITKGKITFISHEDSGAQIIYDIMTRLKFSLKSKNYVRKLVKNHLRLGHLISLDKEPSDKSLRKLNRDCGDLILEMVFLDFADFLSTSQYNFDNYLDHYNKLSKIYFRLKNISVEFTEKYTNIIDGHQIMEIFGLNEGPEVGRVLTAIQQEFINSGKITKTKALKLAKNLLEN